MDLQFINILLGISCLTSVVLSTTLLFKSRAQSSIFLSLSTYGAVLWILSELVFLNVHNDSWTTVAAKLLHAAGAVILTSFTFFSYTFLGPNVFKNKKLFFAALFVFLVCTFFLFFSNLIISFTPYSAKHVIKFGRLYPLYAFYIIGTAFLSYYFLVKKSLAARSKLEKIQLAYIGFGTIASLSFGLILNIVFPFFGRFSFYWLGPFFTIIFVTFATYAILKHHLFNIKVIATEIFGAAIALLLLTNVLTAKTQNEFIVQLCLFFGVAFFDFLLIRGVLNEIKAKEQIAEISENLRKANIQLKKLDQEKSDFLSIASHQLRTPLTVIKGYVSMFNEGVFGILDKKAKDAMSKIYVSSERLIKLIADLLDLSRIERGKMKYIFEKQNLEKIVSEIVLEFAPVAKEKKLCLNYKKPENKIPEISFDADYIRQVLMNLLDNAIKYTEKGGVDIALSAAPSKIRIEIKDTGEGLAEEEKSKLFRRYHRGLEEGTKGLGMGLYLAKKIVDDHKGKIWAESEGKNKGSSFFVELPIL